MSISEFFFGFKPETIARHPEIFSKISDDPRKRQRTTPMQVLALGMSRTGTASMQMSLRHLGYETYHGFRAAADVRDYELWNPAYELKYLGKPSRACPFIDREFLDKVLGHMHAVTDMPANAFGAELIEAYPEAKVVLVERDVEKWYVSFERVFIRSYENWLFAFLAWLDPKKLGPLRVALCHSTARCQFGASSAEEFRANARPVYKAHYAEIRKLLEQRGETDTRLLDFDLSSGWEPLCAFLGKEVPKDEPFPRTNEDKMIQEKIRVMLLNGVRVTLRTTVKVLGSAGAVAGVAWYLWNSV